MDRIYEFFATADLKSEDPDLFAASLYKLNDFPLSDRNSVEPIPFQEFLGYLVNLKMLIEMLSKYIAPDEIANTRPGDKIIKKVDDDYGCGEYNFFVNIGAKAVALYFTDYVFLHYYAKTGKFYFPFSDKSHEHFCKIINRSNFIKSFARSYCNIFPELNYYCKYDYKKDMVTIPRCLDPESFFIKSDYLWLDNVSLLGDTVLYPRYFETDKSVCFSTINLKDELKYYFKAFPEKEKEFHMLVKERSVISKQMGELALETITEIINTAEKPEQLLKDNLKAQKEKERQISEQKEVIASLEKKILFKNKARQKIELINGTIATMKKKIEDLKEQENDLRLTISEEKEKMKIAIEAVEKAEAELKKLNKKYGSDSDFILDMCEKFDYFLKWKAVEE